MSVVVCGAIYKHTHVSAPVVAAEFIWRKDVMEKLEQIPKTTVDTIHHFYCDNCNKHIGSSQEYSDGYYQEFGVFGLSIKLPNGWYKLHKCLCDECKESCLVDVQNSLKKLGFILNEY
jgi:hypothetical protein